MTTATAAAVRCSRRMRGGMLDRRMRSSVGRGTLRSRTVLSRRRVSGMLGARCGSVVCSRGSAMCGRMGLGMLGPVCRSRMMVGSFIAANGG